MDKFANKKMLSKQDLLEDGILIVCNNRISEEYNLQKNRSTTLLLLYEQSPLAGSIAAYTHYNDQFRNFTGRPSVKFVLPIINMV